MKRVRCCVACRRRHRKCVTQPGASQCGTCLESGQECRFENDIRFKQSQSRAHEESERKWAKVPSKSKSFAVDRLREVILKPVVSFTTPRGIDGNALEEPGRPSSTDTAVTIQPVTQPIAETMMDMSMDELAHPQQEVILLHQEHNRWESSLSSIASPPNFNSNGSPYNPSVQVLPVQLHASSPLELTEREAFLFMTYIYKLAPLVSL